MEDEQVNPADEGRRSSEGLGVAAGALCACKDRAASACPGEWEPGCDLGNNPAHASAHHQTPEEREALDTALGLWVCPWRICNTKQAQECRAATGNTKLTRGCGSYFSRGTTLEQARQQINWTPNASLSRQGGRDEP